MMEYWSYERSARPKCATLRRFFNEQAGQIRYANDYVPNGLLNRMLLAAIWPVTHGVRQAQQMNGKVVLGFN